MKVAILFECSGAVRRAMRRRGHEAYSYDLKPSEDASPYHRQADIREALHLDWDLVIAHPPCDYLANSGVQWLSRTPARPRPGVLYGQSRWIALRASAKLFGQVLWDAKTPRLAIENPIMHRHARQLIACPYTQIVQPFHFGDPFRKQTCLWLRGLPRLLPTNDLGDGEQACWRHAPGPERKTNRARTHPGMAEAMADQWAGDAER